MTKGNDGTGNITERDNWETPKKLWNKLDNQYKFNFDCCASENNSKCEEWSEEFDILPKVLFDFKYICWMNPPFSLAREMFEHFFKVVSKGVAIYRCDNLETSLWQEVILANADWVFIPKGRISYEGKEGKGSRFPSALIGKGIPIPKELKGFTLKVQKTKANLGDTKDE